VRLLALVGKELRTFLRDCALVVVVAFMFLWDPYQSASQFTFAINHYPIAAYDLDRSPESRAFLEELRAPYFSLRRYVANDREIAPLLVHNAASAVVVIPEGFGRRILQGQAARDTIVPAALLPAHRVRYPAKGTGFGMLWSDFLGLLLVGTGTFAVGAWRFCGI
jgi:hypothetical protein